MAAKSKTKVCNFIKKMLNKKLKVTLFESTHIMFKQFSIIITNKTVIARKSKLTLPVSNLLFP